MNEWADQKHGPMYRDYEPSVVSKLTSKQETTVHNVKEKITHYRFL